MSEHTSKFVSAVGDLTTSAIVSNVTVGSASQCPIYLDNLATTQLDPRVLEGMLPYFTQDFGNASSKNHAFGRRAMAAVEHAREQVRTLLGGRAESTIIFTSGATESNNLAIRGVIERHLGAKRPHVVTTQIEHSAVLGPCRQLEALGYDVTYVPPDTNGVVSADAVISAITSRTVLVSVMLANNETGAIQPLSTIGAVTRTRGILFHTDATQGIGKVPFDVESANVDLASISGHKLYGPKGIGALYIAKASPKAILSPQQLGGAQEGGLRAGTLNVPGIVGLGEACHLLTLDGPTEEARLQRLRSRFLAQLNSAIEDLELNGSSALSVPGALNLSISGISSAALLTRIGEKLAISTGAACAKSGGDSHVLLAMGLPISRIHSALRFGFGRFTTEQEVDVAAADLIEAVTWIRSQRTYGSHPVTTNI